MVYHLSAGSAVAGGHLLMGRVVPGVELVAHDVAVETGLRVVEKIGAAFGVDESEQGQANREAQRAKHQPGKAGFGKEELFEHKEALAAEVDRHFIAIQTKLTAKLILATMLTSKLHSV